MPADHPDARNIGISCSAAGLVVLDLDGEEGLANGAELGLPGTLVVSTPSGGEHRYLRGPVDEVQTNAGKLASSVDVRAHHGFIVGAGSWIDRHNPQNWKRRPDGTTEMPAGGWYRIKHDLPLALVPEALLARLPKVGERVAPKAVDLSRRDTPEAVLNTARAWLLNEAPEATTGCGGRAATMAVIRRLGDMGVAAGDAFDLMVEENGYNASKCHPPWSFGPQCARQDDLEFLVGESFKSRKSGFRGGQFAGVAIPLVSPPPSRWYRHGDPLPAEPLFLIPGILPAAGVGFLAGERKSGKTFVALAMAHSVATGEPFFGESPIARGTVLYAAFEGRAGARVRLNGLGGDRLPISLLLHDGGLAAGGAWQQLESDLAEEAKWLNDEHGLPVRLIVLDTLAASGAMAEENDNAQGAAFMASAGRLGRTLNAVVVALHHPSKDNRAELRGAGSLSGGADFILRIEREGLAAQRTLEIAKQRDGETGPLGTFRLSPLTIGQDSAGKPVTTCVVDMVRGGAAVKLAKQAAHVPLVEECLELASVGDGINYDGRRLIPRSAAKEYFRARKTGSKDRSNTAKAFDEAADWLVGAKRYDRVPLPDDRETYFAMREPALGVNIPVASPEQLFS